MSAPRVTWTPGEAKLLNSRLQAIRDAAIELQLNAAAPDMAEALLKRVRDCHCQAWGSERVNKCGYCIREIAALKKAGVEL